MRTYVLLLTIFASAAIACAQDAPAPAAASTGTVLARINGQAIPMARLHEILVQDYGLPLARQLIADEVVRQELIRRNLPLEVSPIDLQTQTYETLDNIFQFTTNRSTTEEQEDILRQFLARQGLTRRQWDATMIRNIRLERIANEDVQVTEEEVQAAYEQLIDVKRVARHIQVATREEAEAILKDIKAGADFEALAREKSTNASYHVGGLLPEIGTRTAPADVPEIIVDVVRSMTTVGEVSSLIQAGTAFHIVKLEEIIQPQDVSMDHVQQRLAAAVRKQKVSQASQQILQILIAQAKIDIVDPVVRTQDVEAKQAAQESRNEQ